MFHVLLFTFSVPASFIVISACSNLSANFQKSILGSRIDDGCDALFLNAIFINCDVKVIMRISVIFFFFVIACIEKISITY